MDDVGVGQVGRSRSVTRSLSRCGLPRILGRSAFTTVLSRPVQGSLALGRARLLQPKSLHLSPTQGFSKEVSLTHCLGRYRDEPTISRTGLSPVGNLRPRGAPRCCGQLFHRQPVIH
jgi:hypothetical protein